MRWQLRFSQSKWKKGREVVTDDKGKGVAIDISTDDDDWGDDELLYDGISD